MTLGTLYEQDLSSRITAYKDKSLAPLKNFVVPTYNDTDIMDLLKAEKSLMKMSGDLAAVHIPQFSYDLKTLVDNHYSELEICNTKEKSRLLDECEAAKEKAESDYEEECQRRHDYNESLINPYREKHEQLLQYKSRVEDVCKRYNISPLDMNISDNITEEEFNTLIDSSIEICEKYQSDNRGLFSKIVSPLKGETNLQFVMCYIGVAIFIIYFALPILSICVFTYMIGSTYGMYKDIEKLKIAVALMTQIDYNRFVSEDKLTPPERPDLSLIDAEYAEKIESIHDVSEEREAALSSVVIESKTVEEQVLRTNTEVRDAYAELTEKIKSELTKVQDRIAAILKDYKPFPTVQQDSLTMSHKYTLGRIEDRLDVTAILPQSNIVFNCANYDDGIKQMKLYLCNALLSVRVKQLTVDIYDPKGLCKDFAEFFNPETKEYIKSNDKTLDKLMEEFRNYSQENIRKLDHKDIDAYNKEAEEKEMVTLPYRLLILISEFKELREGDKANVFKEYFKYSAESGVMIWMLDTKKWSGALWVDGVYSTDSGKGIVYDMQLGYKAVETYTTALAKFKDRGISYASKFGDKYIPKEKWWTYDTIHGIDLHFGLENGDPTRGLPITLGDANVHALMGGATGAGKSATINQLLASLITMYPPSELMGVYVDFKNVEAAKFTRGYVKGEKRWMSAEEEKELRDREEYYTRLSRIPQLKLISGTTDGEYALSIFEYLMEEMQRRQQLINKFGVTKIEEMREQILRNYNSSHGTNGTWADMRKDWDWYKPNVYDKYGDLPRLLVIFDEFQVMFNTEFVPQRTIDEISGKITALTKLARAMACHLFFTSQDMKGTMNKSTMANFSLRAALRCTKEVSDELLGNSASSTITSKFGFMYTNDSAGENKDANRFWRVPYLDEKELPNYIDPLYDLLTERNEKHNFADFYDEKVLVPSREINTWYEEYPESFADPNTFIFGERAGFSTNKAPISVTLADDSSENIMVAAFERDDLLNLTLTLIDNVKHKEDEATLVMSVLDKDSYTLLDVPSLVQPELLEIASPEQDLNELLDTIEGIVNMRLEKGGKHKPMFVFCVMWENAQGICTGRDDGKMQEQLKQLLRKAPTVGVHFIFAMREKPTTFCSFIPNSCSHRVAGLLPKNEAWFIDCSKVEKLPDKNKNAGIYAVYKYGTTDVKFRVYQHTFKNKLRERSVVIK